MQIDLHDDQGRVWSGPFEDFATAKADGLVEAELAEIRGQLETDGTATIAGFTGVQFEARVAA